ncbi:hypothetical protein UFOVP1333_26 [uncultured Caudovirales phage]|uniref:Uncharacterized protein n=1 Tax=uncultured Caudovirales phage TaxID=2100421 RepID=A0A6J5RSZ8_9CAUD|nr:hypothetical protein UFOVP1333_26 [uncultured Caudovirales phage]
MLGSGWLDWLLWLFDFRDDGLAVQAALRLNRWIAGQDAAFERIDRLSHHRLCPFYRTLFLVRVEHPYGFREVCNLAQLFVFVRSSLGRDFSKLLRVLLDILQFLFDGLALRFQAVDKAHGVFLDWWVEIYAYFFMSSIHG